jgi:hypothetical protein
MVTTWVNIPSVGHMGVNSIATGVIRTSTSTTTDSLVVVQTTFITESEVVHGALKKKNIDECTYNRFNVKMQEMFIFITRSQALENT